MNNQLPLFAALFALITVPLTGQTPGRLNFERWTGIQGGQGLTELKRDGISQRPADVSALLAGAATSENLGENYGARLRGTVTAPITGNQPQQRIRLVTQKRSRHRKRSQIFIRNQQRSPSNSKEGGHSCPPRIQLHLHT